MVIVFIVDPVIYCCGKSATFHNELILFLLYMWILIVFLIQLLYIKLLIHNKWKKSCKYAMYTPGFAFLYISTVCDPGQQYIMVKNIAIKQDVDGL